jgi:cytochrome P450
VVVGEAVYGGTLNLVSSALFSVDVVDVGAESAHGIREAVKSLVELIAKPNVSDLFPFLRPLDLQGRRRCAARQIVKICRVLDGIIERRLADGSSSSSMYNKQGDFLGTLLELMFSGKITREDVTTIMFDVFTGGSDTIAITVEWTMAELLRNPNAMDMVRAEIKAAVGGKEAIEEPDTVSLPYLHAVMKEAMRLHPMAPILLPHQAAEDGVEIGGYAVPRGSTVIFNAWAIMRDPATWERPDKFIPERFLDKAVDFHGKDHEFIPFGAGRRVCPGIPLAERVVPLILASLLHSFEWRLPEGVSAENLDVSEKFTTANVMAVPLKAVPIII